MLSLSGDYWTTEADLARLFSSSIPKATQGWSRRRVLLYLHGGLNDEQTVARRIVSFRDVLLANEIYPLHIMWETGALETLMNLFEDWLGRDRRAGDVAEWLRTVREGAIEAKDRTLELTAAAPGTALWNKMKQNARAASQQELGGMRLLLKHVQEALASLTTAERQKWEVHIVGHSAGCIFAAHCLPLVSESGLPLRTIQFMAPAITVEDFKDLVMPWIKDKTCPQPTMYVLSDVGERDDDVGPYGKSLLYLVSNAFEPRRGTPILGMQRYISHAGQRPGEEDVVNPEMEALFGRKVDQLPSLVIAGRDEGNGCRSRSESHGGFDNDPATLNSVLFRILGKKPTAEFTVRDLQS
jgi:hypothetical protein